MVPDNDVEPDSEVLKEMEQKKLMREEASRKEKEEALRWEKEKQQKEVRSIEVYLTWHQEERQQRRSKTETPVEKAKPTEARSKPKVEEEAVQISTDVKRTSEQEKQQQEEEKRYSCYQHD